MSELLAPEIDLDELLQRARAEASRRRPAKPAASPAPAAPRSAQAAAVAGNSAQGPQKSLQDLVVPQAIQLKLPKVSRKVYESAFQAAADDRYCVEDLLEYHDRDFIHAAYWALLQRAPDEEGFANYLGHLRRGMPKIEILRVLHDSAEGRKVGAELSGLSRQLGLLKAARWPVIGPIVRVLTAVSSLPEAQRRRRKFEGQIISRMEEGEVTTLHTQMAIHDALRDLEGGHRLLTAYAASKPGRAALAHVESTIELANNSATALRILVDSKPSAEEVNRSLAQTRSSEQELRQALAHIQSSISLVNNTLTILRDTVDGKPNVEQVNESLALIRDSVQELRQSKADQATLDAARGALTRALETRPERYELTKLTNHLLTIAQARLTKEDIIPLEQAHAALRQQSDADRAAFDSSLLQLKVAIEAARGDTRTTIEASKTELRASMAAVRAEITARLQTALLGLNQSIESLTQSKLDRGTLEQARSEFRATLETALGRVQQTVTALSESKVGLQVAVESVRADIGARLQSTSQELHQAIQSLAESKLERGALEQARSEFRATLETALGRVQQTVTAWSESKVGLQVAMESVRADIGARLQSTSQELHQAIRSLADSKLERGALEQTRTELKAILQATLEAAQADSRSSFDANRQRTEAALQQAMVSLTAQAQDLKRTVLDQERRLGLLLEEARRRLPEPISTEQIKKLVAEEDHLLDAMYASFEDRFRGTRAEIKQRANIYIPYIRAANAGLERSPVVDLGCGRGEWLELLRDEGLVGRGADSNRVFLDTCRQIDLKVVESDALAYLRGLKPRSVGAITSFHLIEHLSLKVLIALFDESLRVLKPGGIVIVETPNPENLQVGACNFYTDPTHRKPMPPVLTEALLELRGFVRTVVVRRDQEKQRALAPPRVAGDHTLAANINPMVEVMLANFYVSPDYAVIATKA